MSVFFTTL